MGLVKQKKWFAAKGVFLFKRLSSNPETKFTYEERIILVQSINIDWALKKAEDEAKQYEKEQTGCEYLNFIDCYELYEDTIVDKSEVYSIMRKSNLDPDDFLSRYYSDGTECSVSISTVEKDIDADLVAFGEYSEKISEFLEYDKKYYRNTMLGKKVMVSSMLYSSGENKCNILAECLNIDIWDINQHKINPDKVNILKLKKEFEDDDVKQFVALKKADFDFYFMLYFNNDNQN